MNHESDGNNTIGGSSNDNGTDVTAGSHDDRQDADNYEMLNDSTVVMISRFQGNYSDSDDETDSNSDNAGDAAPGDDKTLTTIATIRMTTTIRTVRIMMLRITVLAMRTRPWNPEPGSSRSSPRKLQALKPRISV